MISVYLTAIGVVAPGLADWPGCRDVLTGQSEYSPEALARYNPEMLPANERRRITPVIRLAIQAAAEAMGMSALPADRVATVFATSNGDLDIADRICQMLTLPERPVSPIDFHNSVHNAPAGYWSIGARCHLPSTSLSAGDASFAAALLEAATQVISAAHPVLLVCYDRPPPEGMTRHRTDAQPFAAALLLERECRGNTQAEIRVYPAEKRDCSQLHLEALEQMRRHNPAAQALLLLDTVARQTPGTCVLPYHDGHGLPVEYLPC